MFESASKCWIFLLFFLFLFLGGGAVPGTELRFMLHIHYFGAGSSALGPHGIGAWIQGLTPTRPELCCLSHIPFHSMWFWKVPDSVIIFSLTMYILCGWLFPLSGWPTQEVTVVSGCRLKLKPTQRGPKPRWLCLLMQVLNTRSETLSLTSETTTLCDRTDPLWSLVSPSVRLGLESLTVPFQVSCDICARSQIQEVLSRRVGLSAREQTLVFSYFRDLHLGLPWKRGERKRGLLLLG